MRMLEHGATELAFDRSRHSRSRRIAPRREAGAKGSGNVRQVIGQILGFRKVGLQVVQLDRAVIVVLDQLVAPRADRSTESVALWKA